MVQNRNNDKNSMTHPDERKVRLSEIFDIRIYGF